jgi:hypothetical protein
MVQSIGRRREHAEFKVKENGQTLDLKLDNVQFGLEIVAKLLDDGHTFLHFTPKLQYGELAPDLRPAPENSEWTYQVSRPSKSFPGTGWQAQLAPNEYLVISANTGMPQSLAYHTFIQDDGTAPVQRLLVIRTNRSAKQEPESKSTNTSPPLAEQACASDSSGPRP